MKLCRSVISRAVAVPVSMSRLALSLISQLQQRTVLKCLLFLGQWKILETIRQCLNKIWCQKGSKEGRTSGSLWSLNCSSWGTVDTDSHLNSRIKICETGQEILGSTDGHVWCEVSLEPSLFSVASNNVKLQLSAPETRCVVPQRCRRRSICACAFQD